ncbi:MAG: phosphatidate cytidylyltransferase [Rhodobacteraceae bacterium]|nr:MAG: phosphatidate cytidylyltransferase [Paracoccaceae bacterium]
MLALIAGRGALPGELANRLEVAPLVCALDGFGPDDLPVDVTFRLETLGTLLAVLRDNGVTDVCMAGAIGRPVLDPSAIDAATLPLVPLLQQAMTSGDDGALRAAIIAFESAGMTVMGAHEVAPDLLPPPGCSTHAQPGAPDRADAARGAEIVAAMAAADIGQACVVQHHQALAVEGAFGTDWMLQSLTTRPDAGGGILFKAPKPGQDRRVDLPTIGPDTIVAACAAGLAGVVIESQGVMVLDRATVLAECNRLGLFLWVRAAPAPG